MKSLLFGFLFFIHLSMMGQWIQSGQSISTTSNEIILNSSGQNSTGTLWLNKYGSAERGNYYIKAYDWWGASLHFEGTGDQKNERMNVSFDGKVGIGVADPLTQFHLYVDGTLSSEVGQYLPMTKIQVNGPQNVVHINDYLLRERIGSDWTTVSYVRGIGVDMFFQEPATLKSWIKQYPYEDRIDFGSSGITSLSIKNGHVGIGTTNPDAVLGIKSNETGWLQTIKGDAVTPNDFVGIKFNIGYSGDDFKWSGLSAVSLSEHGNSCGLGFYVDESEKMRLLGNGFLGICKLKPDYPLDVNGTIRATEIKVENTTTSQLKVDGKIEANSIKLSANGQTADFVFADDYQLRELEDVAQYVKKNNHLPDIPSAEEMEKMGVDLAEMNKLLLQKIEELTLYAIQQGKEKEELRNEVNEVKKTLSGILIILNNKVAEK